MFTVGIHGLRVRLAVSFFCPYRAVAIFVHAGIYSQKKQEHTEKPFLHYKSTLEAISLFSHAHPKDLNIVQMTCESFGGVTLWLPRQQYSVLEYVFDLSAT